ncbi:hypothetical protein GJ496_005998 [Pomphorhynchus laevis]|nr:hypothetical protein GJ496_005998 [Pomphorhynchus laevis]
MDITSNNDCYNENNKIEENMSNEEHKPRNIITLSVSTEGIDYLDKLETHKYSDTQKIYWLLEQNKNKVQ